MMQTVIQIYDKNSFHFLSISKTRDYFKLKFYRLSDATFYDSINIQYQFIKLFLDNKTSIFSNMEPLKCSLHFTNYGMIRKISKTKVWQGIVFYISNSHEKLYENQSQGVKLIYRSNKLFYN